MPALAHHRLRARDLARTCRSLVHAADAIRPIHVAACVAVASRQDETSPGEQLFAQAGEMGEHASSFPTPRVGLRNLARDLYEIGAMEDDSMQALGAFVAAAEGLEVEACRTGG
jgi:hypothetical protein